MPRRPGANIWDGKRTSREGGVHTELDKLGPEAVDMCVWHLAAQEGPHGPVWSISDTGREGAKGQGARKMMDGLLAGALDTKGV